jgi:hypothetical protein
MITVGWVPGTCALITSGEGQERGVVGERPNLAARLQALHGATLTPLVGREEEIDLLRRQWHRAKRGEGRVARQWRRLNPLRSLPR